MPVAEIDQSWISSGGTGGMTPVQIYNSVIEWAFYAEKDNSTITVSLQSAQNSTGPWVTEGSTTTNSTAAEQFVMRGDGAMPWVRPYITARTNTNTINFRLIGY